MLWYNIPVLKTVATPANPPTGFLSIYFKSDGKLYTLDSLGVETDLSEAIWGSITGTLSDQLDLQAALNAQQPLLVSWTNIKTINGQTLLGSGDIVISGSISDWDKWDITVSVAGTVWTIDNGTITIAKLAATGTPDNTTFLRWDNTWATPPTAWAPARWDIVGTLSDQTDLNSALGGKENALWFTPENVANKDTNTALWSSNTAYPSQLAVKTYVDTLWISLDARTFNYQLQTSVASGDITITLLNYLGTTPSTTTPVRIRVWNTLNTITTAQTLTINNDGFYHFEAGSDTLATYEIDYFVYWWDATGLCVSRLPWYTNFAQQWANQQDFLANGWWFAAQNLVNIGRYNAIKASGTTGNWSIPGTSIIINKPIFYTRNLNFTPVLQGSWGSIGTMAASPYTGTYTIRDNSCFYRVNIKCTNVGSWSGNVEVNLPFICKNEMWDSPVSWFVWPVWANPATASRAVPYTTANTDLQRHLAGIDSANLSWGTFVVNDIIRAEGFYNIV